MTKGLAWRIVFVGFALALSILFLVPSTPLGRYLPASMHKYLPKINLGLDLQGGMHLVLNVEVEDAIQTTVEREMGQMRLDLLKVQGFKSLARSAEQAVTLVVETENGEALSRVRDVLAKEYEGWSLRDEGSTRLLVTLSDSEQKTISETVVSQALENIRRRVDESGVAEPSIQPQGERRIVVQLPGVKNPEEMRKRIGQTGKLTFHIGKFDSETWNLLKGLDGKVGGKLLPLLRERKDESPRVVFKEADQEAVEELLGRKEALAAVPRQWRFALGRVEVDPGLGRVRGLYVMKKKAEIGGERLRGARVGFAESERVVFIRWDRKGARDFEEVTGANVGKPLAIVLDDFVQSAPVIQSKITRTGEGYIRGRFTIDEAQSLRILLTSGALPTRISFELEETVGPSLGSDSVRRGVTAGIAGLILVGLFIGVYYLGGGLIANFAILCNMVLLLACLAGLRATLTLPGIAGIILTIGMAVDANVLIFERMREESASGKSIRAAIAAGYNRAFITIFDSNLTTLLAAMVLMWVGSGPVRGFGVTLSIGIITSVFSSVVITRVIFDLLSLRRTFHRVRMFKLLSKPSFRFVAWRHWAYAASAVAIISGLVALSIRGDKCLGVEFRGGILLRRTFSEPVRIERVRTALTTVGLGESIIQDYDSGRGIILRTGARGGATEMASRIDDALKKEFGQAFRDPAAAGETTVVGPWVGERMKRFAMIAIGIALVVQMLYLGVRFRFWWAATAVIAVFHDVLFITGVFGIMGKEITLQIVAALMTIIGYSVNDTIVIMDRIRENLRVMRKEYFPRVVDLSINQTLSRTILTAGTTLVALLALFIAGGEVIHDFAFALIVGVFEGTYSTVYVAVPLLVEAYLRSQRRMRRQEVK